MNKTSWVAISALVAQLLFMLGAWGAYGGNLSFLFEMDSVELSAQAIRTDESIGRSILTLGEPSNPDGLVSCNRGYHVGDPSSCGLCELLATAQRVVNFLILAGVLIASIMFAYAGFLYVTSSTNPGNIAKAKGIFWNVLFGLVAVLAAWIVVNTVLNTIYGRPLLTVSNILCTGDLRNEGLLPNPDMGITVVGTAVTNAIAAVNTLEQQIATLEKEIEECNKIVAKADKEACLATRVGRLNQLKEQLTSAEKKLEDAVIKDSLKSNEERLKSIADKEAQIIALLGQKQACQALSDFACEARIDSQIDALEADIAFLNSIPASSEISTYESLGPNPNVFIPESDITTARAVLVSNNTTPYASLIEAELARQRVAISPELVRAIMSAESGGNPNATSPVGAVGLMQVMPSTARQYFPGMSDAQIAQELRNPETNIRVGIQVLNSNLNNPNVRPGNTNDLIASYNSGAGNQLTSGGKKPALADSSDCPGARAYECSINPGGLTETRNYVARVNYYNQYYTGKNTPAASTQPTNANTNTDTIKGSDLPNGDVQIYENN